MGVLLPYSYLRHRRLELLVRRWCRILDPKIDKKENNNEQDFGGYDLSRHLAMRAGINCVACREQPLCKLWASNRSCQGERCVFRHHFVRSDEKAKVFAIDVLRMQSRQVSEQERSIYDQAEDMPHNVSKASKKQRAAHFAKWIVGQYGVQALRRGTGILDVAGGHGDLSWVLSIDADIPCTLIDPAVRRGGALTRKQRRILRKTGKKMFSHLPLYFNAAQFGSRADTDAVEHRQDNNASSKEAAFLQFQATYASLLQNASLVVGLHPDEATEAIVDLSLSWNLSLQ